MRGKPLVLLLPFGLLTATLACVSADVPAPLAPPATPLVVKEEVVTTVLDAELALQAQVPTPTPTLEPTPEPTPTLIFMTEEELMNGEVLLEIQKIGLSVPIEVAEIVSDGSSFQKNDNPTWIPQWSQFIGQEGVALVYGERQWGPTPKVFTSLDKLEPGDVITVRSAVKVFHFRVLGSVVIDPSEIWLTFQTYDQEARSLRSSQLALLTCTPWGTARQRLIVFAELIGEEEDLPEEILNQ